MNSFEWPLIKMDIIATTDNLFAFTKEIEESPRKAFDIQLKLYDVLLPIVAGVIIGVNLMIVFSSGLILKKRTQPRSTYIFLGNVALADMLTGVSTVLGQYFPRHLRGEMLCCIQLGLIIASTLASILTLALIAVDRFLFILYGLQYQRYLASKRARLMALGTWVVGGVVGFLPAMGWRNPSDNGRLCWLIILEPKPLVLLTVTVGIIPLIMIFVLYGIILRRALGKISEMRHSETTTPKKLRYFRGKAVTTTTGASSPTQTVIMMNRPSLSNASRQLSTISGSMMSEVESTPEPAPSSFWNCMCLRRKNRVKISNVYNPSRWKAIKIVAFTTGAFFVTWCPYFVACALYSMCDQSKTPNYCDGLRVAIASPLAILGLVNGLLNPIIYAWWHNGFRESSKRIYNNIWRRRFKPTMDAIKGRASVSKCSDEAEKVQNSVQENPSKGLSEKSTDDEVLSSSEEPSQSHNINEEDNKNSDACKAEQEKQQ